MADLVINQCTHGEDLRVRQSTSEGQHPRCVHILVQPLERVGRPRPGREIEMVAQVDGFGKVILPGRSRVGESVRGVHIEAVL